MDPGQRSIGIGACYFNLLVPIRQEVWEEGDAGAGVQDLSCPNARDSFLQPRQGVRGLPLPAPLVKRIRYPTLSVRRENLRIFLQKDASCGSDCCEEGSSQQIIVLSEGRDPRGQVGLHFHAL
jgi:hypothetical protein